MVRELGLNEPLSWKLIRQFISVVAVPQLLFYLFAVWQGPLIAAVGLGGGWTVFLQVHSLLRQRIADPMSLYGLAFTTGQVGVALLARSPAVYAGSGIAENLLYGVVLLASVAVSRPLLPVVIDWILRRQTHAVLTLPVRSALTRLTLAWAVGSVARAAAIYVALTHLPLGLFLVANTLIGWPLTGVGALASIAYVRAYVRRGGRVASQNARVRSLPARCAA